MAAPKKIILVGALLLLGLSRAWPFPTAPQANSAPAEDALNEGIRLLAEYRYVDAVEAFNRFKQTAPEDARPYFYSGLALAEVKRLSAAASELKEAVRLAPERLEYRVLQASVLAQLDHQEEGLRALEPFRKAGIRQQLEASGLKLLAEDYYRLAQFDESLNTLKLLSERTPADGSVDFDRGKVEILKGRPDLALQSFKKSIEKSTDDPAAFFELGKLQYQNNELTGAKQALLEAVKRDPGNPEYVYKVGMVCLALDELPEALEYLKRAEPSASTFSEIYFALGRAYQRLGNRALGDEYRRKFGAATSAKREKDDQNRLAGRFISQGERQLDQGNTAQARALFEQAAQTDPNRWDAHGYLAEILLSSDNWQQAYPHLVKMEEIEPDSVVGNYLMATYWYKRKEYAPALGYAAKVKVSRPGNSELRNLLGNLYLALGQKEKALQEYQAAVQLAPDRADFRENLRRAENEELEGKRPAAPH